MIEARIKELAQRLRRKTDLAERLQLDLERPVRALQDGYPENTVLLAGIIVENLLKHIWCETGIRGDPARKQLQDLLNGCKEHLRDRTINDHIQLIAQTRNRASHDGGIVEDEDALDVLRRLGLILEWFHANFQIAKGDEPTLDDRLAERVQFAAGLYSVLGYQLEERHNLTRNTAYQLYTRQQGLRADVIELILSERAEELTAVLDAEDQLIKSPYPKVTRLVAVGSGRHQAKSLDLPGRWSEAELVPFDGLAGRFLDFSAYRRRALQADAGGCTELSAAGELLELNRATASYTIDRVDDAQELIADTYFEGRGNLLVIGQPGAGKTHQVRRLFRSALHEGRGRIVFFFDLGGKPSNRSLSEYLSDSLAQYFNVQRHLVYPLYAYLSRAGRVLNIFDGLDEACPSGTFEEFMNVFSAVAELLSIESQIIATTRTAFLEDAPYTRQLLDRDALVSEKVAQEVKAAGIDPMSLPNFRVLKLSPVPIDTDAAIYGTPLEARMQVVTGFDLESEGMDTQRNAKLTKAYVEQGLHGGLTTLDRLAQFFGEALLRGQLAFRVTELIDEFGPDFIDGALDVGKPALSHLLTRDPATASVRFVHRSFQEFLAALRLIDGLPEENPHLLVTEQTRQFLNALHPVDEVEPTGLVSAGTYLVGPSDRLRYHRVVRPFRIAQYPVTVSEYREFLGVVRNEGARPYEHPAQPDNIDHEPLHDRAPPGYFKGDQYRDHPTTNVSYWSAHAYATWRGMRLPTAVEWEVAARGVDGRTFPWGEEPLPNIANTADYWAGRPLLTYDMWKREIDDGGLRDARTLRVGRFPDNRSPFGAFDMCGKVWEWTSTMDYGKDRAVICGGSYDNPIRGARVHSKGAFRTEGRSNVVGFRCVEEVRE